MVEGLDKVDMKLLSELDENSRKPLSQIAKKLRVNQNTLQFRLKKLTENEIILGFYPSIDLSKLGFMAVRVYFSFVNTSPEEEKTILLELTKSKICTVVAELEANYDVMFMAGVKNISEFYSFWNNFKEKHRKFIEREEISFVVKVEHFKRSYLLNAPRKDSEKVGGAVEIKLDNEDKKILSILAKDCRVSSLDISEKTKIPPRTVIFKIKQLEKKGVILGYRINLNLSKLNYEYFKLNIRLSDTKRVKELDNFCRQNLNVIFIDYTVSKWDFEMDLEMKGKEELIEFIKSLKRKFPVFKEIEIISFSKYHKIETIPFLF